MTHTEMRALVAKYEASWKAGEITAHELDGLLEALIEPVDPAAVDAPRDKA